MIIDYLCFFFFFQAEDGIRDVAVTGVQTCALPISIHRAVLRSASGRWVKQKFAPASLWPQSSAMVQRRRGRSGSRHNSKWCWGLCRFFLSIRPQMLRTAGFEHSLSGSANRSAATTCSSLLMLLRLVIPWLATTQGSLLRSEAYNERTGFVPLKGKILFLSNSVQPKGMSTRREGQALCEPA